MHCIAPHRTAPYCNALQRTATHCNALYRTAPHCNAPHCTATHCNILQHTATHCNTLQRTATHCITLQHTEHIVRIGSSLCETIRYPESLRVLIDRETVAVHRLSRYGVATISRLLKIVGLFCIKIIGLCCKRAL